MDKLVWWRGKLLIGRAYTLTGARLSVGEAVTDKLITSDASQITGKLGRKSINYHEFTFS